MSLNFFCYVAVIFLGHILIQELFSFYEDHVNLAIGSVLGVEMTALLFCVEAFGVS